MKLKATWNTTFSRSSLGEDFFFVKGGRDGWEDARLILDSYFLRDGYDEAYPGGDVKGFTHIYGFGDGGVFYKDGNWFCGMRGMWVRGFHTLRLMLLLMNIEGPQRLKGEQKVPDKEELIALLKRQQLHTAEQVLLQAVVKYYFWNRD